MTEVYVGWIPTVLGNLSFKSVGLSDYPYPFHISCLENDSTGEILLKCLQKRVPPDYQIPLIPLPDRVYLNFCSFIADKIFQENIENSFLIIGEGKVDDTGTVQHINGHVYRFSKTKLLDQRLVYSKLINLVQGKSESTNSNLEEYIKEEAFFSCDFKLDRQGICELSNPSILKDGMNLDIDEKQIRRIVNQCFFFIKDAFHSHKHHDKSEDTLVGIHTKKDEYGNYWSEHILKGLYRYILTQRSVLDKNSLGIFSYIRTFNKIIENSTELKKASTLFSRTVALDELEKSITIQIEKKEESILYRRWFAGFFLAVSQMTGFYIFSSNRDKYSGIIENNTDLTLTLALSLLLIVLVYTKNINPLYAKSSTRFFNLIISAFSKKRAFMVLVASGLICIFLGLIFLLIV